MSRPDASSGANEPAVSYRRRRLDRPLASSRLHLRRPRSTRATPAIPSPRRSWPMASISSGDRSNITGRAESWRRRGGAERAGQPHPRAGPLHAQSACDPGRALRRPGGVEPESLAVARIRRRRDQRSCCRRCSAPASTTRPSWVRTSWQELGVDAYLRAVDPRRGGLGKAPREPDPDRYQRTFAHCDVLIVGAGPAGLAAALAASASGAGVVLCDENADAGGSLLAETRRGSRAKRPRLAGEDSRRASKRAQRALMTRTQAFGYYAQNFIALAERMAESELIANPDLPRERLWQMRAREVVLATGAIERPLVFPDNDRPGVMLADAARRYALQYGVERRESAWWSRPRMTAPIAPRSISRQPASISRWSPTFGRSQRRRWPTRRAPRESRSRRGRRCSAPTGGCGVEAVAARYRRQRCAPSPATRC